MAVRQTCILYADEMANQSKAFKNFLRGISSLATKSDYTQYLKNFMSFHKFGNHFDDVVKSSTEKIDDLQQAFGMNNRLAVGGIAPSIEEYKKNFMITAGEIWGSDFS